MARRGGGGDSFLAKIAMSVILVCLGLGFVNVPVPNDTKGVVQIFTAKSEAVNEWVQEFSADGFNIKKFFGGIDVDGRLGETADKITKSLDGAGTSSGNGKAVSDKIDSKAATDGLGNLKVAPAASVDYDRGEWNHWINANGSSCWNVREEVLHRDSVKNSVVFLDKNKKETKNKRDACSIKSGKWIDLYTGATFTDPAKLDIDHMIALSYAAKHGGNDWSSTKKEKYANDMSNPLHLIAVSASENRAKGDKGPSEWKPKDKSSHCAYAGAWVSVAGSYGISVSAADSKTLAAMLKTC